MAIKSVNIHLVFLTQPSQRVILFVGLGAEGPCHFQLDGWSRFMCRIREENADFHEGEAWIVKGSGATAVGDVSSRAD